MLSGEDASVLEAINAMRRELADVMRRPRRWQGGLRRTMLAHAIQGSNSIEGYVVDLDDAAAALDDEEPLSADEQTFAEIRGYRQALGYVLQMAADPHFVVDVSAIRGMHYMMLAHDLSKSPGQYRTAPIYVRHDRVGSVVYEGRRPKLVHELIAELVADLRGYHDVDPIVRGAMAHLNLVMIHPFRDGNGRMARALQLWSCPAKRLSSHHSRVSRSGWAAIPTTTTEYWPRPDAAHGSRNSTRTCG
ncbi:MAG: Fic family protein [Jiangellaceae bacterium]